MSRAPLLSLLLLAWGASACSLAPPRGIAINAIATTSSTDILRLQLRDYGKNPDVNWDSIEDAQALLNTTSGTLVAHDSNLEFMPQPSGFMEQDVGSFAEGIANVSGREFGKRSFALNMTMVPDGPFGPSLVWWYSASLARFFFFSEQSHQLAVCTSDGECQMRQDQLPTVFGLTARNGVLVWDEERLAALPLLCCVCRQREYVTYDESGNLRKVDALDTLGTTHYDAAHDTVFAAHGAYTEYADALRVERYNYATHESLTVSLSKATLEGMFESGSDTTWALFVFIPVGGVLAVAMIASIIVLGRRRHTTTKAVLRMSKDVATHEHEKGPLPRA